MLIAFIFGIAISNTRANPAAYQQINADTQTVEVSIDSNTNNSTILDSIRNDSISPDSLVKIIKDDPKKMESSFKSKVTYHANDSLMIDNKKNKAYLWGAAWVKYEDIELKADYLEIDFAANEVTAMGLPDSTGKIVNTPVFIEKGKEYQSGEMVYNFQSKKGLIKKITTQEASGYIHGDRVKMESTDIFYIRNGKYTTCNLDHPHYYVKSQKLKIINNDKIVTGPAYLAIEDVPTFLAIPFGFFPNQDTRTSGIIVPSFGNSATQGFGLERGGYYFGISDKMDLKLTGTVFTNGTWTALAETEYRERYKRSGKLSFKYTNRKLGEKDASDYSINKSFFINWRHTQDPKARPNSNFSAIVNFGSLDDSQNDITTTDQNYLRNEFSSNITYFQKFGTSPFSLKLNASHNQNNIDSTVSITLPELALNMTRIYPFKRKVKIGKDKWYEKIGVNYSGNFKNQLSTTIEEFGRDENLTSMRNGAKHSVSTSTSLKLGHLNLSPGVAYNETWYFKSFTQRLDSTYMDIGEGDSAWVKAIEKDTTLGFYRFGTLSINATLGTKLFGMYVFKRGNIKAIRHVITPLIRFSYVPNISKTHPEMFGMVEDTTGEINQYSIFDGSVYNTPNGKESGNVGFELQNIIEMKHKKRNDTTDKFVNTRLIDRWNFRTSYNMLADEYNWSPMNMDIQTRIGKLINWRLSSISDFYGLDAEGKRTPQFNYNLTQVPLRLTRLTTSVGLRFNGKSKSNNKDQQKIEDLNYEMNERNIYQQDQYIDFNIPWDLNVTYVFTYSKPGFVSTIINSLQFQGNMNLTQGWKLGIASSYDFQLNKLGYTRLTVNRDLHCWQIDFNVTPFGERKSYMINIKVKQGFLQDLKLSKNSRWFD